MAERIRMHAGSRFGPLVIHSDFVSRALYVLPAPHQNVWVLNEVCVRSDAPFKDFSLGPRSSPQTYNTDIAANLTHKVHPRGTIGNEPRQSVLQADEIPLPGPSDYLGPSQPSPFKKIAGFSKSKSKRFPAKLPARDEANSLLNPQQGAIRVQHPRVVTCLVRATLQIFTCCDCRYSLLKRDLTTRQMTDCRCLGSDQGLATLSHQGQGITTLSWQCLWLPTAAPSTNSRLEYHYRQPQAQMLTCENSATCYCVCVKTQSYFVAFIFHAG